MSASLRDGMRRCHLLVTRSDMWSLVSSVGVVSAATTAFVRRGTFAPVFLSVANYTKVVSKARRKRLPLTTKHAGKGYYKGNRARKEGHITSKGNFILDPRRCTEIVVPDFTNCNLQAYIGPGAKRNIREKSGADS